MATDPHPRPALKVSAARGARGTAPPVRAAAVRPARAADERRSVADPTARAAAAPAGAAERTVSAKTATRPSPARGTAPRKTAPRKTTTGKTATGKTATGKTAAGATASSRADRRSRAPVGRSLHIGLNAVGAAHYGGWRGELCACEFDAGDMAALARAQGMKARVLLTREATRAAVLRRLHAAARALRAGDLFFLSFSGHGGQVPDVSGEERDDKLDETWCLYDAQLIDDELYTALTRFAAGVRIVVLSDSCHSGTVVRAGPASARADGATAPGQRTRMMPPAVARRVYRDHQDFYDRLQRELSAQAAARAPADPDAALAQLALNPRLGALAARLGAAVILIAGCQDNQSSYDGEHNGAFTEQLLAVWNDGRFRGHYAALHARVRARMPARQSPNLFVLGPAAAFLRQSAFSV
jgi:hypothetical protein